METGLLRVGGKPSEVGRACGAVLQRAVRQNVGAFWHTVTAAGYDRRTLWAAAEQREDLLSDHRLEEIEGLARGAGIEYPDVLAYNVFNAMVMPDECTVYMAVGNASATGDTLFGKNSDKVGGSSLVGPNFHQFKEINVALAVKAAAGHTIVGVSAAGQTGMKMAVSSLGIAAGANIGRTEAMQRKALELTQIRAIDRAQLLRDGLERTTALAACQDTVARVMETPMATPGNLEFADARTCYIVEGSYSELAQATIRDDIAVRSNMFVLLKALNQWSDISSQARYIRATQFLRERQGRVTMADLIALSTDHENGPGPNSICRHGTTPEEEVSLSAMVCAINGADPGRTRVALALGKPCHAWRDEQGHISLQMDFGLDEIPTQFTNGDVWRRFYDEHP